MELRDKSTGQLIGTTEFRALHKNTSFPPTLSAEIVEDFGYDIVQYAPQPTVTPPYEFVERDGVEEVDGVWCEKWVVSTVADPTAQDAKRAEHVRNSRARRLEVCDWTVLPDAPFTEEERAAWVSYRQALRDISEAPGFPYTHEWPVEPS